MPFRAFASVVFDFSGTLCSDLYFRSLGPSFLAQVQELVFGEDKTVVDRWMTGVWSSHDVADWLSPRCGRNSVEIDAALRRGCAGLVFNRRALQLAEEIHQSGVKTALVTINADVFTEVVVPAHDLDATFDVIVNSATRQDTDKRRLWEQAFRELGSGVGFRNSLLIDDNEICVEWFREAGGVAYRYAGDDQLAAWLMSGCS